MNVERTFSRRKGFMHKVNEIYADIVLEKSQAIIIAVDFNIVSINIFLFFILAI